MAEEGNDRAGDRVVRPDDVSANRDELADNLIEKREKLQYFIITASAAFIVFTFNNLNGGLGLGPTWVTYVGWALLLLASGTALFLIQLRHSHYARYLDQLYGRGAGLTKEQNERASQIRIWGQRLLLLAFVAGVGFLIAAHGLALAKGPSAKGIS